MLKTSMLTLCGIAACGSVICGNAWGQAQPFLPAGPQKTWSVDAGAGAVYGFSANGGSPDKVNVIPYVAFNYKNRLYGDPLSGIGYNAILRDRFRAGFQLRPHFGGNSHGLPGLVVPGLGADLAGYAYYRVGGNVSLGGRLMHDVSGVSKGSTLMLSAGHQMITPVGLLQTLAYTRFGDRKTNQAYYGVTPSEAAATGLSPYDVGGSIQNAGIVFLMMTPIKRRYAVATFVNAERALGDVANSPLIQLRKNREMSYRAGLVIVRRFGD